MSRPVDNQGHEHELEPQFGLPEPLPASERILWQGSPDWRALALRVFHVRKLAIYFALVMAARGAFLLADGATAAGVAFDMLKLAPLPLFALAVLASLAWLTSRTTVYTVTDRRVVMRIGIVLTLTFNLPLRTLRNADLHRNRDGTGDIAVQIPDGDRIAYLHLWPHVRPWHVRHPQPMFRCVPDAAWVAKILVTAWSAATGVSATGTAAASDIAAQRRPAVAAQSQRDNTRGALPAH